jgi:DNA-binding response OmpR family regulator
MRLLIIEDERDLSAALSRGLQRQGYAVDVAETGTSGLELLETVTYDLAVVDLSLPDLDGLEIVASIRPKRPELLLLVLTARSNPDDRILGLDAGADDYLTKPFHFAELCARMRALLRRDLRTRLPILQHGDLRVDPSERVAWQGRRRLRLRRKEFALLEYLLRRDGEVVSQEDILDHVWDAQVNPLTNVVPVHIASLRRALRDDPRAPRYIRTVIGEGYQLVGSDG